MVYLMINVHKAPIYIRQSLDLILQILREIVSSPEGHVRREYNVDLDKVLGTAVVDLDCVDGGDLGREGHRLNVSCRT